MSDIEDRNLNIPDQLYVGVKGGKKFDELMFPLAFATPYGTDRAFANRKNTVDTWAHTRFTYDYVKDENGHPVRDERGYTQRVTIDNGEYQGEIVDNIPTEGFTFEKSVSRWRTQNKWFAINDPRGFQLQISAENLGDLLINCGIENGNLKGKFVWAKDKNNIFLCRVTHPSYVAKNAPKVPQEDYAPGDVVSLGSEGTQYVYMGSAYCVRAGRINRYISPTGERMSLDFTPSYSYSFYGRQEAKYTYEYVGVHEKDTQKVHIYRSEEEEGSYSYKLLRSKPKKYKVISKAESIPELPKEFVRVNSNLNGSWGKFFTKKEEMLAAEITLEDWYSKYRKQREDWTAKYGYSYKEDPVVTHLGDVSKLNMREHAYW